MCGSRKEKHFNDGQLFALQSTDCKDYDDHINCVSDPDELAEQAGLVEVYYSGTKVLDNGMNRFMVIGRWVILYIVQCLLLWVMN